MCAISCPKKIIKMRENNSGFYSPYIVDSSECISCGTCLDICSLLKEKPCDIVDSVKKTYAAKSLDAAVLKMSSSGGISFEIGKFGVKNGYKVCACAYDSENDIVKHIICKDESDLRKTFGSKYIPSYTVEAFSDLNKAEKFIVIGTPCQIDSIRRWARKFKCEDNYILIDIFCHGVPSMLMYRKYRKFVEKHIGKIKHISWRNKDYGWHSSCYMRVKGENGEFIDNPINPIRGIYYFAFLTDFILSKSCYKCKYKHCSTSADIRIGDFWGEKYNKDESGVSLVYVFTEKGQALIKSISDNIKISEEKFGDGLINQPSKAPKLPLLYNVILQLYRSPLNVRQINMFLEFYRKLIRLYQIICTKL